MPHRKVFFESEFSSKMDTLLSPEEAFEICESLHSLNLHTLFPILPLSIRCSLNSEEFLTLKELVAPTILENKIKARKERFNGEKKGVQQIVDAEGKTLTHSNTSTNNSCLC